MATLAIVQCGARKIWKNDPKRGPTPAKEAYTSGYFQKNRAYAERFADRWLILSAKYGFLNPDTRIHNYNVSFLEPKSKPISRAQLQAQVKMKRLSCYRHVVVLGGVLYADKVQEAFCSIKSRIHRPFNGLRGIGYIQQRVTRALRQGKPFSLR